MQSHDSKRLTFWITALVSLGGILYGYDIGVIAGAILFIRNSIPMSDTQLGMVVSAVLGGSLLGTFAAGPLADSYGRRFIIQFSSIIFVLGVCLILLAHSFLWMFLGRGLLGVGIGIVSVSVPLYVAEIVLPKDRGKYMTFFQLLLTFGILLAYFIDLLFTPSGNWRAMFAVVLIPALILGFGVFFLPETPRWLIAKGYVAEAQLILNRLRPKEMVVNDIRSIQESLKFTEGKFKELFSPQLIVPTFIAVSIAIFNQLTGINSFLQYAPLILKNAGLNSNTMTMVGSLSIGLLNFLCTMIALFFIDTLGRRPLLLFGLLGVILSEVLLGFIQLLELSPFTLGMLSLLGLFAFIVFFAIGPGVVVWLVIAELFPTKVRGKGMACCLFFNSLAATLLAAFFIPLSKYLGMADSYFLFSGFSFFYFLIVLFWLPETKTKTLEEIQFHFQRKSEFSREEAE